MDENFSQFQEQYLNFHLEFTLEFYKAVLLGTSGTIVFCPLGLLTSLCLLGSGTDGNTAAQFQRLLRLDSLEANSKIHSFLQALIQFLQNGPTETNFRLINALFTQQGFSVHPTFQKFVEEYYKGQIKYEDFAKNAEAASDTINRWVEKETNEKIKNIVNPADLDEKTRLLLLTVVYFKNAWVNKFNLKSTIREKFHLLNGNTKTLSMMIQTNRFNFGHSEDLDCSLLEMPYAGNRFSMVILLPNAVDGLAELEEKLDLKTLTDISKSLQPATVNVMLPKFQVESTIFLKDILTSLGLSEVFSEGKANLSKMSEEDVLFVSEMQQRSVIEVDEEGTEATSATVAQMRKVRSLMDEEVFHADHPFIFLVREANSRSILFLGRFVEPQTQLPTKDEL